MTPTDVGGMSATIREEVAGWRRTNMVPPWYGEVRTLVGALRAPWVHLYRYAAWQRSVAALRCHARGQPVGLKPA